MTSKTIGRDRTGYLPSLDGWRAVAVLAVMFTHDYYHYLGRWNFGFLHDYGGQGVILFFAISGILITTRILEEETLRGSLNLRGFYIRRFFRIQPAAVTYLLVAAVVVPFGLTLDGGWKYWIGSLFFFRNYLPHDVGPFSYFAAGHFWTLAVEEHFYLLLSLLLYFNRKNRVVIFGLLAFATALIPRVLNHLHWINPATTPRTTQESLWYLVWPAFLAVLLKKPEVRQFAMKHLQPWKVFLSILLVILLSSVPRLGHTLLSADRTLRLVLLVLPILLIGTILHSGSWTTQFLELKFMKFIGRISYSLYLWHVIFFLSRWSPRSDIPNPTPHWFTHAPWNYVPAFVCATLSFYFIEKPFMRLGHRLAPPATPGRPDLNDSPSNA